jgi:hypothetical protein
MLNRSFVTSSLLANCSRDGCALAVGRIRVASWSDVPLSGFTCSQIASAIDMSDVTGEPGNRRRAVFPAYLMVEIPIRRSGAF